MRIVFLNLILSCFALNLLAKTPDISEAAEPEIVYSLKIVQSVRTELRVAVHNTNRYIACIKNDIHWFKKNSIDFRDNIKLCSGFTKSLRRGVKQNFSLMKVYLALARPLAGMQMQIFAHPMDVKKLREPLWTYESTVGYRNLRHMHRSMADIPDLTLDEVRQAYSILNSDLEIKKKLVNGDEINENQMAMNTCALKSFEKFNEDAFLGPEVRECYNERYQALILGDASSNTKGSPLLAYVSSPIPTDAELIYALNKLIENAQKILKSIELKFYTKNKFGNLQVDSGLISGLDDIYSLFGFERAINRVTNFNSIDLEFYNQGKDKFQSRELWTALGSVSVVFGGIIACNLIRVSMLAKGLCKMPFGLGMNVFFIAWDEKKYLNALESILVSADGYRSLNSIDRLDDLNFNRTISWVMLPLGTGLVEVAKHGIDSASAAYLSSKIDLPHWLLDRMVKIRSGMLAN